MGLLGHFTKRMSPAKVAVRRLVSTLCTQNNKIAYHGTHSRLVQQKLSRANTDGQADIMHSYDRYG
jgi:hypothetical protein